MTSIQGPFSFTVSTHEYTRNSSAIRLSTIQSRYLLFFPFSGMAVKDGRDGLRRDEGRRGDAVGADCVTTLFVTIPLRTHGGSLGQIDEITTSQQIRS